MTADHMVCETELSDQNCCDIIFERRSRGPEGFQGENGKNKKLLRSHLYLSLYSQFFTSKFRFIQPSCMFPQWRRT